MKNKSFELNLNEQAEGEHSIAGRKKKQND